MKSFPLSYSIATGPARGLAPSGYAKNILVFEGDSMTAGGNFAADVLDLLGGSELYDSENISTSGQTVADMITQFASQAEPLSRPSARRNVLVLRAGTNDLYFEATAAETIDNITDYCALARAAGFKIVIGTILPRSGFGQPAELPARRLEVNDWLRLNWRTIADGFADVSADPRIGDPGDEDDTDYYSDQVHMTTAGNLIAAEYYADAINRMYMTNVPIPLFIFNGESNSGGIGLNSDANVTELNVHRKVQIFNNDTDYFQYLQLGVNNLRDHDGLSSYYDNSHGLELGIANAVEAGRIQSDVAYILKTGQGGSEIAEWANPGTYYNEFETRSLAVQDLLAGETVEPIIFFTLGINDRIAGTNAATWKAAVIAHFANLRTVWGATTPIYITDFHNPPMNALNETYNTQIYEIVDADPYTYLLDASVATTVRDENHWDYEAFLELAEELFDTHYGTLGTLTAPTMTEGGTFEEAVLVSIGSVEDADIRYSTDGSNPSSHSTLYTGAFSVASTTTVKAIAIKKGYKNSAVSSETYDVDVPSAYLTFGNLSLAIMDGDAIRCNVGVGSGFNPGAGGVATETIDPTVPFELSWYGANSAQVSALVVGLMTSLNTNYAWGNTTLIGSFYNYEGSDAYGTDITGNNVFGPSPSVLPKYYKIKNSGNDLLYQHSADGVSYTTLYTQTGVLTGLTELWVKVIFAVDGTTKNAAIQLTGG